MLSSATVKAPGHSTPMTSLVRLQQRDRFEVLAPALCVGDPLAGVARVVAVEHRGHRIDAQAIDAELLDPVERAADEEVLHLVAAEVVDQRVPVLVEAFARVGVFVQRGAVELRQAVRVGRKVRGHPIHQHADALGMAGLDEACEAFGGAEARGRRVQAERLVAPGTVERIFADRQQLDVREAEVGGVGRQRIGELVPRVQAPIGMAPPRGGVQLVDRHRRGARVGLRAAWRQCTRWRQRRRDDAGRGRPQLGRARIRVGLGRQHVAVAAADLELVAVCRPRHAE